ncbi:MAG: hypothetical protein ACKV0T_29745 [Planctomycetales bacterium]
MSKSQLALTSLVAALPGGWLAYLMVMAFLGPGAGGWPILKGLAGTLLLIGATLAVMPVGILLFSGPKTVKPPKKKKTDAEPAAEAGEVEEEREEVSEFTDAGPSAEMAVVDDSTWDAEAAVEEFGGDENDAARPSAEFDELAETITTDSVDNASAFELDDEEESSKKA